MMEDDDDDKKNKKKWFSKKPKHKHPNPDDQNPTATTTTIKPKKPTSSSSSSSTPVDISFKPSSDVKGLKFGGQLIIKSFTIRRTTPFELLRLLSLPPPQPQTTTRPFPSTIAFIPTNFTILAHQAWNTLTLGLGTNKSKVLILVFESQSLRTFADRICPQEIPLGQVNRRILRAFVGCDLARFKFRKGCLTFYVYAIRSGSQSGTAPVLFQRAQDLRTILEAVIALRDFIDHTAMLAMANQRTIGSTQCYDSSSNTKNPNSSVPSQSQSSSSSVSTKPTRAAAMAH